MILAFFLGGLSPLSAKLKKQTKVHHAYGSGSSAIVNQTVIWDGALLVVVAETANISGQKHVDVWDTEEEEVTSFVLEEDVINEISHTVANQIHKTKFNSIKSNTIQYKSSLEKNTCLKLIQ